MPTEDEHIDMEHIEEHLAQLACTPVVMSGTCPYEGCDAPVMEPSGKRLPCILPVKCPGNLADAEPPVEGCGRTIWHVFLPMDPISYTQEGFRELWEINELVHKMVPEEAVEKWEEE